MSKVTGGGGAGRQKGPLSGESENYKILLKIQYHRETKPLKKKHRNFSICIIKNGAMERVKVKSKQKRRKNGVVERESARRRQISTSTSTGKKRIPLPSALAIL